MNLATGGIPTPSAIHHIFAAGSIKPVPRSSLSDIQRDYGSLRALCQDLALYGINLNEHDVYAMAEASAKTYGVKAAMDAIQIATTTPSIPVPLQFLQNWLPGFVNIITDARKIDDLVPLVTTGSWEDVQVVQGIMEPLGLAVPYGDYTTVPYANWNPNYVYRNIVRFEQGMLVGKLESAQAAKGNINNDAQKRNAAATSLEIQRNYIGFYGFNAGVNLTYGFLNDPGLPSYVTASNGASGSPLWSSKTYLEIVNDLKAMIINVRTVSGDQVDFTKVNGTLALASAVVDQLTTVSQFGNSVKQWLNENFPKIRVESAPELNGANGGQNVAYLYADRMNDGSTDDGLVFMNMVPTKFQTVGVAQEVKGYIEDYTNAMAGVMCKRPWAVTRLTGI